MTGSDNHKQQPEKREKPRFGQKSKSTGRVNPPITVKVKGGPNVCIVWDTRQNRPRLGQVRGKKMWGFRRNSFKTVVKRGGGSRSGKKPLRATWDSPRYGTTFKLRQERGRGSLKPLGYWKGLHNYWKKESLRNQNSTTKISLNIR